MDYRGIQQVGPPVSRFDQMAQRIAMARGAADYASTAMNARSQYQQQKESDRMAKAQKQMRLGVDPQTAFKRAGFGGKELDDILRRMKTQTLREQEELAGAEEMARARKLGLTPEELREQERAATRRRKEDSARTSSLRELNFGIGSAPRPSWAGY
jgi:hypothetical protein